MEQEEGREMPEGVESQTGYCRFCGQGGVVHTMMGWGQDEVNEAVTCRCQCKEAKKYAESKERVQKAKSRIEELFSSTAEKPIDQSVTVFQSPGTPGSCLWFPTYLPTSCSLAASRRKGLQWSLLLAP